MHFTNMVKDWKIEREEEETKSLFQRTDHGYYYVYIEEMLG